MVNIPKADGSVILLGDRDTEQRIGMLREKAAEHAVLIVETHTFEIGEPSQYDDLSDVEAVMTAIVRALSIRADIWAPFHREDLGRDEHIRRLSLVLQRHGLNLRLGQHLWPCPLTGGLNEIDFALRREVHAVDDLDNAVIAAAGLTTLGKEIETALYTEARPIAGVPGNRIEDWFADALADMEADFGPSPTLPAITAQWSERRPALKQFAGWLIKDCGMTHGEAAKLLNASGHRTALGRDWRRATISALIKSNSGRQSAA